MIKIGIFSLIVFTISFAIVYKRPLIARPWEWLMTIFGLKDSLKCTLCTPLWIGMVLSALNVFLLPQMGITPSLVMFGEPTGWLEYAGCIFIDSFSVAAIVYLMDQFNNYFLEYRGKLNITIKKEEENNSQILLD